MSKKRLWQHWTPQERSKMYQMIKDGFTDHEIGAKLNRSARSVEVKRLSRGMLRRVGRPAIYRPDGWPILSDPDRAFQNLFKQVRQL